MTYPRPLQLLHWGFALLVTAQLAIAGVLGQLRSLAYGQWVLEVHRQLGLVILLLVLTRFVVACRHRPPADGHAGLPGWQHAAAGLVHRLFLICLVVQPMLGVLSAWGRGDSVGVLGLFRVAAPWEMSDLGHERVMTAHWEKVGQPDTYAVRKFWHAP